MTKLRTAGFVLRRHRPSGSAVAFNHALAITGDPIAATSIAATALRRGAHSRTGITAHARHISLEHARKAQTFATDTVAGPELHDLTQQLIQTRPAVERALVDLELRYQLDKSTFARVIGLSNERAAARSTEVAKIWAETLDPAVMAWLGPGSCDTLAAVLTQAQLWPRSSDVPIVSSIDSTGPVPLLSTGTDGTVIEPASTTPTSVSAVTVDALLAAVPAINEHATQCDVCSTRLAMLTPVRTLFGQTPLAEVPKSVVESARNAYRHIPTALPPSIEPHRVDISRLRVPAFTSAALAAVVLSGGLIVASRDDKPSQQDRVNALVEAPASSSLLATPSTFSVATKTAALANNASTPITWNATSSVEWLKLKPTSGQLQPSQSISIEITNSEPSNNRTGAIITISGSDGSTQTLQYKSAH